LITRLGYLRCRCLTRRLTHHPNTKQNYLSRVPNLTAGGCRAKVFLAGYGWIAADPADVRKVALEEPPGHLPLGDPKVVAARETLFGGWEGNWLAYNFAHDLDLPGANGRKLAFLMYPQAQCGTERLDCLNPNTFRYSITAKEVTSA
jgi:hypothetical protein